MIFYQTGKSYQYLILNLGFGIERNLMTTIFWVKLEYFGIIWLVGNHMLPYNIRDLPNDGNILVYFFFKFQYKYSHLFTSLCLILKNIFNIEI